VDITRILSGPRGLRTDVSCLDAAFSQQHFASMIEALEIERVTFTKRLQAMELLWRSMSVKPGKLESPAWHKKVLAKRLAKVEAGKGEFLTLAQLKKRLHNL
jgi:hypothetical protein